MRLLLLRRPAVLHAPAFILLSLLLPRLARQDCRLQLGPGECVTTHGDGCAVVCTGMGAVVCNGVPCMPVGQHASPWVPCKAAQVTTHSSADPSTSLTGFRYDAGYRRQRGRASQQPGGHKPTLAQPRGAARSARQLCLGAKRVGVAAAWLHEALKLPLPVDCCVAAPLHAPLPHIAPPCSACLLRIPTPWASFCGSWRPGSCPGRASPTRSR